MTTISAATRQTLSTDVMIPHRWKEGLWKRAPNSMLKRTDTCSLCGCERYHLHYKGVTELGSFCRSNVGFDKEPACWGGPNP